MKDSEPRVDRMRVGMFSLMKGKIKFSAKKTIPEDSKLCGESW